MFCRLILPLILSIIAIHNNLSGGLLVSFTLIESREIFVISDKNVLVLSNIPKFSLHIALLNFLDSYQFWNAIYHYFMNIIPQKKSNNITTKSNGCRQHITGRIPPSGVCSLESKTRKTSKNRIFNSLSVESTQIVNVHFWSSEGSQYRPKPLIVYRSMRSRLWPLLFVLLEFDISACWVIA